jgi:hypothetical protein
LVSQVSLWFIIPGHRVNDGGSNSEDQEDPYDFHVKLQWGYGQGYIYARDLKN